MLIKLSPSFVPNIVYLIFGLCLHAWRCGACSCEEHREWHDWWNQLLLSLNCYSHTTRSRLTLFGSFHHH
jgi:hypothetical protein